MLLLSAISKSIISVGIWIVSGIYHVAAWAFELFLILSTGQLLSADTYDLLIKNFYVILGIVMLFFFSFLLLKSMVNPEEDKGTTTIRKVITNLITSSIILVLLPTIFTFLFDFQNSVIVNQNTIGRFFGYGGDNNTNVTSSFETIKSGAFQIVNGVFTAFFNVDTDVCVGQSLQECQHTIENNDYNQRLDEAIEKVNTTGSFSKYYSNFSKEVDKGNIDFNFLLSLIAGVVLAYVGISFCIDMAVRLVKLVFYQLIAPIPLFARIIPDTKLSGTFNEWLKVTLTCYLEVYIRIFALYFSIFLCNKMLESDFLNNQVMGYGWFIALLARAFILMGIIIFMRQIPKLLSEVTGLDSSNMKLGLRDKLKDAGVFTAGAAIGGGLTALTRNAVNAGSNIKNKYKEARDAGKGKLASIWNAKGAAARGVSSVLAGGASGAFRSGKAGWKAGSAADMKNAATSGAKAAVDARDIREAYKAKHGGHILNIPKDADGKRSLFTTDASGKKHLNVDGTIAGHIADVWDTGKRWAGFNNIAEYQESISSMDNINSKVDAVAEEARKVLASNAKTGKTFSYGLAGVINEAIKDSSKNPDYQGIEMAYSLDNYRALENAIQRAQDSGGITTLTVKNGNGVEETRTFTVDVLNRLQNQYVTDYSEAIANQAFKSVEHYKDIVDNMDDYKEQAAMSAIRAKAEDARNELSRVLNSEAVGRANRATYEYYYKDALKKLGVSDIKNATEDESRRAEEEVNKIMSTLVLNAETINGDLRITDRTALNYYGSAAKEVKSEYLTEISKIQQKEKDKNGK